MSRTVHPSALLAVLVVALTVSLPHRSAAQSPDHENAISSVISIHGNSPGILPPAGFTKIPVDLNAGAGGDYVYLCYKRGPGAPVTGLAVLLHGNDYGQAGWGRLTGDLNSGAGGAFVYLWGTRDPSCAVLQDLGVVVGQNTPAPAGWTRIEADLNAGAGGEFVYIVYRLGDNDFLM